MVKSLNEEYKELIGVTSENENISGGSIGDYTYKRDEEVLTSPQIEKQWGMMEDVVKIAQEHLDYLMVLRPQRMATFVQLSKELERKMDGATDNASVSEARSTVPDTLATIHKLTTQIKAQMKQQFKKEVNLEDLYEKIKSGI